MNLTLDKNQFIKKFLNPIQSVSEECQINITEDHIYTIVQNPTGSVFLFSKIDTETKAEDSLTLNIKQVKKLSKVLDCIPKEKIDLDVNSNGSVIRYKSPELSFKLHLVSEQAINKCKAPIEKINRLEFDAEFDLTKEKLTEILKGSIFADECNKVYFFTRDSSMYAELTDMEQSDMDSITFNIVDEYEGEDIKQPIPFNLELLRIISSSKPSTIRVKINNEYKILLFEQKDEDSVLKYIVSAFVK